MKLVILLFFLSLSAALANDTAIVDGSDGPAPLGSRLGPESVIRMVRERLEITFGSKDTAVHATFVFLNMKTDAPAKQTVGFPDRSAMIKAGIDESDINGPIRDLVTLVDGQQRKSRQVRGWVIERDGLDEPAKAGDKGATERIWHAIDVEFPVGKEVVIERRYKVANGSSVAADPEVYFNYTTATGGVWKGTIGELIADVTLTDGLTVDSLLWNGAQGAGMSPAKNHWRIQSPTRMQLVWKDFEPRTDKQRRGIKVSRPLRPASD
ncbi:MAG TPA: hypothetical protein VM940_04355 [Chthoniobacterales bacterium]|jgi:hypothetical protein|nr:hypothetical protein [Chthoniobacterales bacterium]